MINLSYFVFVAYNTDILRLYCKHQEIAKDFFTVFFFFFLIILIVNCLDFFPYILKYIIHYIPTYWSGISTTIKRA